MTPHDTWTLAFYAAAVACLVAAVVLAVMAWRADR